MVVWQHCSILARNQTYTIMIQSRKRRAVYKHHRDLAAKQEEERGNNITTKSTTTRTTTTVSEQRHGHKYFCDLCKIGSQRQKSHLEHLNGRKHKKVVEEWESAVREYIREVPTWRHTVQPVANVIIPYKFGTEEERTFTVLVPEQPIDENDSMDLDESIDVRSSWRAAEFKDFPHRSSCVDPSILISTLSPQLRARFWRYLRDTFGKHYPELTSILHCVSVSHPQYMRVKELFENLEAFQLVSKIILVSQQKSDRTDNIDTIYDLACGHGLLGILLAYRFPTKRVVCIDLQRRQSFFAFRSAFVKHGIQHKNQPILSNLEYREADLISIKEQVTPSDCLVAVHACNEANKHVVEMARTAGATWAVLPCCIRSKLYLKGSPVLDVDSETRYKLFCGAFAEANRASVIRSIPRDVTGRPILIAGGFSLRDTSTVYPSINEHAP